MNEINLNALSGPIDIGRSPNAAVGPKKSGNKPAFAGTDSAEFSKLPDLSEIDQAVDGEFSDLRSRLQKSVDSELYPPLETIDKLAAMLAVDLNPGPHKPV